MQVSALNSFDHDSFKLQLLRLKHLHILLNRPSTLSFSIPAPSEDMAAITEDSGVVASARERNGEDLQIHEFRDKERRCGELYRRVWDSELAVEVRTEGEDVAVFYRWFFWEGETYLRWMKCASCRRLHLRWGLRKKAIWGGWRRFSGLGRLGRGLVSLHRRFPKKRIQCIQLSRAASLVSLMK